MSDTAVDPIVEALDELRRAIRRELPPLADSPEPVSGICFPQDKPLTIDEPLHDAEDFTVFLKQDDFLSKITVSDTRQTAGRRLNRDGSFTQEITITDGPVRC